MADKKNGAPRIIKTLEPNAERERKFIPVVPAEIAARGDRAIADYKAQRLLEIYRYICDSTNEFITHDHPVFAPVLPPGVEMAFEPPITRTRPRERLYFADALLDVEKQNLEIRLELTSYGCKQTIKMDSGDANRNTPTLDRMEFQARLRGIGVNMEAIDTTVDKLQRRRLRQSFSGAGLKPLFRMLSQRLKVSYHPEGNPDVMIEVACDTRLVGETVFGDIWYDPKLELEIKEPAGLTAAQADFILTREEGRFLNRFALERQFESNGAVGYRHLRTKLLTPEGRKFFRNLRTEDRWWEQDRRTVPAQQPERTPVRLQRPA